MVYGVSGSPNTLGRNTVENLERFGFKGSVYLVGRKRSELNGRKIYRHIEEIDAVPDLAVFLIPAKAIPDVLEQCGWKGIPYMASPGILHKTEAKGVILDISHPQALAMIEETKGARILKGFR